MNKEIKETLERLEELRNSNYIFSTFDIGLVLDYITNLQTIEREYSAILSENADLQQENERLKETNVYCNRTDCIGRIKDSRKYDSVYQEKEDYKSRCEKAIEYIKDRFDEDRGMWIIDCYDLLNILQNGSDSQ